MTTSTLTGGRVTYTRAPLYSWWVLLVSLLCFMCCFIGLNTVAVFGTVIQDDWGINATNCRCSPPHRCSRSAWFRSSPASGPPVSE